MTFTIRKRLLSLIVTGVAVPFLIDYGVPEQTVQWLVGLVMAYIGGQSITDYMAINKGTKEN